MKIVVGSKNEVKVQAVAETITEYDMFLRARIHSLEVPSDVADQPKSLEETIQGAKNRAQNAFDGCDYSFGIESGLMQVPHTKTGYMDVCACAIYDGETFHLGLSSCFEYPREVARLVFEEGLNISQAFNKAGLTSNEKLGAAEGGIGILTKGRLDRKRYTKQAVRTALIHLENRHLFS